MTPRRGKRNHAAIVLGLGFGWYDRQAGVVAGTWLGLLEHRVASPPHRWWCSGCPRSTRPSHQETAPNRGINEHHRTTTMAASILKQTLPSTIREIRIHFSPSHANPIKSFIQSNYSSIKSSNPDLPILFRESSIGTPARAIVRFEYGVEKQVSLEKANSSQEIELLVSNLIQSKSWCSRLSPAFCEMSSIAFYARLSGRVSSICIIGTCQRYSCNRQSLLNQLRS